MHKIHPKIYDALNIMHLTKGKTGLPFYSEFCLSVNFVEDNNLGTCACNVTSKGMNFYYDVKFIERLTIYELIFVIVHEVLHLISRHNSRHNKKYHIHKVSNIVMDMIINYNIIKMVNDYRENEMKGKDRTCFSIDGVDNDFNIAIPKFEDTEENRKKNIAGLNSTYVIPNEYDDVHIFEVLYDWYYNKLKPKADSLLNKALSDYQEKEKEKNNNSESDEENDNKSGDGLDGIEDKGDTSLGGDIQSDSEGVDKGDSDDGDKGSGVVGNSSEKQQEKTYSNMPDSDGAIETAVGRYGPFGKDDMHTFEDSDNAGLSAILEGVIGKHMEDTVDSGYADAIVKDTINKVKSRGLLTGNVESIIESITATKRDIISEILREIDRSIAGAMIRERTYTRTSRREIEGVKGRRKYSSCLNVILDSSGSMMGLIEIVLGYIFKKEVEINLVICDTEIKKHIKISDTSKLNNLQITGFGGTIMQVGVDYVAENLNKYDTILLTDGYTDSLDLSKLNKDFMVITTNDEVNILSSNRPVKQFIVDENDF